MSRVSSADVSPSLTPSPGMASLVTAERSYVLLAVSCVQDEPVRAANIVLSVWHLVDSAVKTVTSRACVPGIDCGTQRCVAVF